MNLSHKTAALPLLLAPLLLTSTIPAQDPPLRASLRGSYLQGFRRADTWAEGNLGMLSHIGVNAVDLFDVSGPGNPQILVRYTVPAPNATASTQDVKSGNGLMFVGLSGGGSGSVQIVDVRVPANPVSLTVVQIPGFSSVHNLFYSKGWLYMCAGVGSSFAVVDLRSYDPDNAPAVIGSATYVVGGNGSVHDLTVVNDLLWVCDISGSLRVFDVSRLGTRPPLFAGSIAGGSVHSVWASADDTFVVTADESFGGPIKLFEVVPAGERLDLIQRDSWVNPLSGLGASGDAHNPTIDGDRVYLSNNGAGVLCLQIDRTTKTWEKVASYDTSTVPPSAASGQGCWGIYPFLGADRVLASDRQSGFFVLDFSALEIAFVAPPPEKLVPGATNTIDMTITALGNAVLDPATVLLAASVNGGAFLSSPMVSIGASTWRGTFPPLACGDRVDFYVSARDTLGRENCRPGEAPAKLYTAYASNGGAIVFSDDFETDKGWTVSATGPLVSGAWERGVPVDNGFQPPFDDPDGTGSSCYVTEIGTGGNDDVDGGTTELTSPEMDFAGTDGLISYRLWHYNDDADGSESEPMLVRLSNDGGATWTTVASSLLRGGGWQRGVFRISDHLPATSRMRVRFEASDMPNNSVVEGGVDSFVAETIGCLTTPAAAVFRNGSGINPAVYASVTLPVLGSSWDTTVDVSAHPGAALTLLAFFAAPSTGPILSFGELLVDVQSPLLLQDVAAVTAPLNPHRVPVPLDLGLVGAFAATQALIADSAGGFELCNAIDVTLGF